MASSYDFINTTGAVVADTASHLSDVQSEYQEAFGADIDLSPSTPQGLLISAEVLSRDGIARNNATLANQINPNLAGGIFLDAIWALTGGGRVAATRSTVTATLNGLVGVTVPSGSKVKTTAGDEFQLIDPVALPGDGNFESVEYGEIAAPSGTLTEIVDSVLGWDTVTNAADATLGTETQSDNLARIQRRNTLALMGATISEAITSGLNYLEGVSSVAFRENTTNASAVIDGITIPAHSIWACVYGGDATEIATVLMLRKSSGAGYTGTQTVSVTDPYSGQVYTVKFDRPSVIQFFVRVTIKSGATVSDPTASVKSSCANYADANWGCGVDVSPFELSGQINQDNPGIFVTKVEVRKSTDVTWSAVQVDIALNEIATLTESSVTVVQV